MAEAQMKAACEQMARLREARLAREAAGFVPDGSGMALCGSPTPLHVENGTSLPSFKGVL